MWYSFRGGCCVVVGVSLAHLDPQAARTNVALCCVVDGKTMVGWVHCSVLSGRKQHDATTTRRLLGAAAARSSRATRGRRRLRHGVAESTSMTGRLVLLTTEAGAEPSRSGPRERIVIYDRRKQKQSARATADADVLRLFAMLVSRVYQPRWVRPVSVSCACLIARPVGRAGAAWLARRGYHIAILQHVHISVRRAAR